MSGSQQPRVLSGIQPTADSFHLGNFLGALRQWVRLQDDHDTYCFIANLHAITVEHDPAVLRERTYRALAQLIALGLNPQRCTLFLQSHVPEHAQLGWVLGCQTAFGEASRMTQFKDKSQRQIAASVGLFFYPILQAADILLYQADQVPVGEDQRQHLELTRDLAQRFNTRFGHTFVVPEPYILRDTAKILDLQTPEKQMSKSLGGSGCLNLMDDPKILTKRIRSAVTDAEREIRADPVAKPGVTNLLNILSALRGTSVSDLERKLDGSGYGALKDEVVAAVLDLALPAQQRVRELLADRAELDAILARGAQTARQTSRSTLATVYDRVGFLAPAG